jgi:hypothetical protein
MNPSFDVNSDQDFELAFAGLAGKDFVGLRDICQRVF